MAVTSNITDIWDIVSKPVKVQKRIRVKSGKPRTKTGLSHISPSDLKTGDYKIIEPVPSDVGIELKPHGKDGRM